MDGFGLLVGIVAFVLVLVAFNKLSRLETRLAQLRMELDALRARPPVPFPAPAPALEPLPADADRQAIEDRIAAQVSDWVAAPPAAAPAEETAAAPAPAQLTPLEEFAAAAPAPRSPGRDMEQTLASRWFVWIGGLAIAVGGLLFVKYAYDEGLISPVMQIVLGLIAGAVLVLAGLGNWIR